MFSKPNGVFWYFHFDQHNQAFVTEPYHMLVVTKPNQSVTKTVKIGQTMASYVLLLNTLSHKNVPQYYMFLEIIFSMTKY